MFCNKFAWHTWDMLGSFAFCKHTFAFVWHTFLWFVHNAWHMLGRPALYTKHMTGTLDVGLAELAYACHTWRMFCILCVCLSHFLYVLHTFWMPCTLGICLVQLAYYAWHTWHSLTRLVYAWHYWLILGTLGVCLATWASPWHTLHS